MSEISLGMLLDNRYQLVDMIGKGGMAIVYLANDLRTGHQVAVKILNPDFNDDEEFLERFDREAAAASKMSHHNIVNLLDVGNDQGYRYLVMEYVQGKTLKDVIQERGAMPADVAAQVAIRILSALQHAHKNGIIHRDIKPQNILVHSEGHIKVADFGIAHMADGGALSKNDNIMGSVYYFSPEQAKGLEVTSASDIYSVGIVLYEMLTGHVPFDGDTPVAVAMMQIKNDPVPMTHYVKDIPVSMTRIVKKAMEKNPDKRYQSAFEMAQDLHHVLHSPDSILETDDDQDSGIIPIFENNTNDNNGNTTITPARHVKWIVLTACTVAALLLIVWGTRYLADIIIKSTTAPYLINETEESALNLINKAGLKAEISRTSHAEVPRGHVIIQTPDFDTNMRKGESIAVTISTGPDPQEIPDITGQSSEAAMKELEKYGFTLLVLPEKVLSAFEYGTVISQEPKAGTVLSQNGIVKVKLSGGSTTLPSLVGTSLDEAKSIVAQKGISIKDIAVEYVSDEALNDKIVTQQYLDENNNILETGLEVMLNCGIQVILAVQRVQTEGSVK